MPSYDHPEYTVIREKHITGAISSPGIASAYVGSTMRSSMKAVITGVSFRIGSGGSAAGTNSMAVGRLNGAGTVSSWQVLTVNVSAGASGASFGRNCFDISLVSALTMHSLGEGAVLSATAASLDKQAVLSDIVWRYRVLYGGDSELTSATAG